MATLVDTNILVYRFDPRRLDKQARARRFLAEGLARDSVRLPHQALLEFVPAATKPVKDRAPLLSPIEAWHELEKLLTDFPVLYPTDEVLRAAVRGATLHRLSWFDAHLWAYAHCYGIEEIASEDFQHGRIYGSVRATNPLL